MDFTLEIENRTIKPVWLGFVKSNSDINEKLYSIGPSYCKSLIKKATFNISSEYNLMRYCFFVFNSDMEFNTSKKLYYCLESGENKQNLIITPFFGGKFSKSIKIVIIMGNQHESIDKNEENKHKEYLLELVDKFMENEVPEKNISILLNDQVTPKLVEERLKSISSLCVDGDVIFIYLSGIGLILERNEVKNNKEFELLTSEGNISSSLIFDCLKNSKVSNMYFAFNSNYSGQIIEDYKIIGNSINSACKIITSTSKYLNEKSNIKFIRLLCENLIDKFNDVTDFEEICKRLASNKNNLKNGLMIQYFDSKSLNQINDQINEEKIKEEKFKYERYSNSGEIKKEYDEEWVNISERYQLFLSIYLKDFPHKNLIFQKFPKAKLHTLSEILSTYIINFDHNNIRQRIDEPLELTKSDNIYSTWSYHLGYYDGFIYKNEDPNFVGRLSINISNFKFDKQDNIIGNIKYCSSSDQGNKVINDMDCWIQGVLDKNRKIICFNEDNLYRYIIQFSDDNKSIIGYYGYSFGMFDSSYDCSDLKTKVILYKNDKVTEFGKCIEIRNLIHKKQYQISIKKRQIYLNLEVANIEIDQNRECFTLTGHLILKWKITIEEIFKALASKDISNYIPEWKPPKMKFKNGVDVIEYNENNVIWKKTEDNLIPTLIVDIKVVLSEKFELNNFPFDIQFLTMDAILENGLNYEEKLEPINEILLIPETNINGYFIELPDRLSSSNEWEFMKSAYSVLPSDQSKSEYNRLVVSFRMKRNYISYIIKICLIMCIISLLSNGLFSLNPTDQLGDRLTYGVTLLLTDAAYILVISSSVPVLPYLTIIEKYIITNFCYISLNIILISFNQMTNYFISDELTMTFSFIAWTIIHLYFILLVRYSIIPEELSKLSKTIKMEDYEYQHILNSSENIFNSDANNNICSFPIENETCDELKELINFEEKIKI